MDTNPAPAIRRHLLPLPVLALAALLCALVLVVIPQTPANSVPSAEHHQDALFSPRTSRQVAFHDQMRKLWEDHVTWTRLAIVTFADGSASFDATATRLLRNQTDIGDAIKPYYGQAAGNTLTSLLRDHITIAVELLQAVKAGDSTAVEDANGRWYTNANEIADFLSAANPRFWPSAEMRAAMKAHLDQTLAEAAHELTGDYTASVADYETVHHHILEMADLLSSGLMRQFPAQFR